MAKDTTVRTHDNTIDTADDPIGSLGKDTNKRDWLRSLVRTSCSYSICVAADNGITFHDRHPAMTRGCPVPFRRLGVSRMS